MRKTNFFEAQIPSSDMMYFNSNEPIPSSLQFSVQDNEELKRAFGYTFFTGIGFLGDIAVPSMGVGRPTEGSNWVY